MIGCCFLLFDFGLQSIAFSKSNPGAVGRLEKVGAKQSTAKPSSALRLMFFLKKNTSEQSSLCSDVVRAWGLEPQRRRHENLNLACLPIPSCPRIQNIKRQESLPFAKSLFYTARQPRRSIPLYPYGKILPHLISICQSVPKELKKRKSCVLGIDKTFNCAKMFSLNVLMKRIKGFWTFREKTAVEVFVHAFEGHFGTACEE